jgi:hypothetical protein
MTCIVSPQSYPTKKALRLWVLKDPDCVTIHNPSMFTTLTSFSANQIGPGQEYTVTNHPRRSWFAQVGRKADGTLYVK